MEKNENNIYSEPNIIKMKHDRTKWNISMKGFKFKNALICAEQIFFPYIFRKAQYKDVNTRTIEIPQSLL